MMSGGDVALRGFLVQTLIALLEALKDDPPWTSVTLEPNLDSEKVDILWVYQDGTKKAVQVKSSKNPFSPTQVKQWAGELQKARLPTGTNCAWSVPRRRPSRSLASRRC
jgi:hypothetical protein